jgi:tagatose 1,6-diphosphate aldolase GatY/KbaY
LTTPFKNEVIMLTSTETLLQTALSQGYAIGAFNVYNLEGVKAVVAAAEGERSPAMLQIHPGALGYGGPPLVALCLAAAEGAAVPMAVHLDHSDSVQAIEAALVAGISSIMADGSHMAYEDNLTFSRDMVALAHAHGKAVEAELGRISGTEDGLTVDEREARYTDPAQAADFVAQTGVDALAVCIGNVHGKYHTEPQLDFARLSAIRQSVSAPLVLHGASGLPDDMVRRSIDLGICKFNVNTEVRQAYMTSLKARLSASKSPDLLDLMADAVTAMQAVVAKKLRLFGSKGKANR